MTDRENREKTAAGVIRSRHVLMKAAREFFYDREYIEVETPYLARSAPTDPFIEPLKAFAGDAGPFYLHTSPEVGMKKFLARGMERIFEICKVFRVEELEDAHSIEFTMLEWYGPGTYEEAISQTEALVRYLDNALRGAPSCASDPWPVYVLSDLFLEMTAIDPLPLSRNELFKQMSNRGFGGKSDDSWEDLFFKLLVQEIEPRLNEREKTPYFIKDWPASLTAMAKKKDASTVERFELYMAGLEIANGYSELLDPKEQKLRMIRDNEERMRLGKALFPLDEAFLEALEAIPGPVAGVSIGMDRLLMALLGSRSIADVLPGRLILGLP